MSRPDSTELLVRVLDDLYHERAVVERLEQDLDTVKRRFDALKLSVINTEQDRAILPAERKA
ncbi:hypothetical protein LCGC14_0723320 [marine sediment metagenome]|uniref:Uncharacterized protein n=1 Tax=marine sediment metagenome TaxID=412755 RepID=A0A0F9SX57_9ZZZZ